MLETTVARLLQSACQDKNDQEKKYIVFCEVIFEYIVSHPNLTATEKLTWLVIDKAVRRNPDLICCLSYRHIGQAINVTKDTAYRLVRALKKQQFLLTSLSNDRNQVIYTTNLPAEGIALLKGILQAQVLRDQILQDQTLQDKKTSTLEPILARCCAIILRIRRRFR